MMVIRGALGTAYDGVTATPDVHNFPADRCVWSQSYNANTRQYTITSARFFGITAGGAAITNPELGHIGKSGRFVPITE